MVTLWEKMQFWKRPKVYREKIDYDFVEFEGKDITGIILLIEEYKEVIYHYHKARIVEEGELARLQFGYTIIHPGNFDIDDLNSDEKFHTIMGDILTIILESKAKDEKIGTNDSQIIDVQ